ncbi:unnamed protein product [Cuscuta campestris]|uniref:Zinc knuckle CX2CX4HX4C domain-containing protein n=1 Tax=Cuscuta campestris TaxID=132261 RepID=A0A484KLI2_9ASTE|nr:unnamed protein product [Cuscuta campestris]
MTPYSPLLMRMTTSDFSCEDLGSLGATPSIGKPIKMDEHTTSGARMERPRICIEVDVSKPLPPYVHARLGDKDHIFPLSYENLPSFCHSCLKLGHALQSCLSRGFAGRKVHNIGKDKVAGARDEDAGWIVVQGKKNKQQTTKDKVTHFWKRKAGPAPWYSCQALASKPILPHPTPVPPIPHPNALSLPDGPQLTPLFDDSEAGGSKDDSMTDFISQDPTLTILHSLGLHDLYPSDFSQEDLVELHCHSEGEYEPFIKGELLPLHLNIAKHVSKGVGAPRGPRKKRSYPPSNILTRSQKLGIGVPHPVNL